MPTINNKARILLILAMLMGITALVYLVKQDRVNYQIFFRELYFVPIMLAGFWFGLRGAVLSSVGITVLYLPYTIMNWRGFSASDVHRMMELLLYNGVAVILGLLKQREWAEQERVRQAASLAAMGKALSAVAHDMKTPLVAIGGFARLVQKHMQEDNPHRDKLEIVIQETGRLENMVKDMLDFSRPLALHSTEQDVHHLVEESVAVMGDLIQSHGVQVRYDIRSGQLEAYLDPMRMKQVLINLITNAIQASPPGEPVTVRCSLQGKELLIEVVDHGVGIPPDRKEEVFQPFISTKKEGTGLGLAIVQKIVEAHQGSIEVRDNPEGGTTFAVVLPVTKK